MLYNNIKIAFRTLVKNKVYTIINIVGLMVGIAAALLIYRMVSYEKSFNKNFPDYERIVRVVSDRDNDPSGKSKGVCLPLPAMTAVIETVPQLMYTARIRELWPTLSTPGKNGITPKTKFAVSDQETAFYAEPDFLKIFPSTFLAGNPETALDDPASIVLTESWANKLFDDWKNAMNQTVLINNIISVVVTGVMEDYPVNTDFPVPALISYKTLLQNREIYYLGDDDNWGNCSSNNQLYGMLHDKNQMAEANSAVAKIGTAEYNDGIRNIEKGEKFQLLQPLSMLHHDENFGHSGTHRTDHKELRILSLIGLLILLIACFNFINLATAQATARAKEVGVRKTLGGRPGQLMGQFMSETALIVFFAVALGVMLAEFALPLLSYISEVPTSYPFLATGSIWLYIGSIFIGVTLLAGLYPSFVLSSYRPVEALSKKIKTRSLGGLNLQRGLVVVQFVVSALLIIGSIITIQQMNYIQNQDLGFNKDLVYSFGMNNDSISLAKHQPLINTLKEIPEVVGVSLNSDHPLSTNMWSGNFRVQGREEDEKFSATYKFSDENYDEVFGLKLLAGTYLTPSDTFKHLVINETMLEKLNFESPEAALNEKLQVWGKYYPIVGVVEDFFTRTIHDEKLPLIISTRRDFYWLAAVKIKPQNVNQTLAAIRNGFDKIYPEQVLEGKFMDERIAGFYEAEQRLTALCQGFGFLAIFISCLGLLGLAMHAAARRTKEIGVRKVLGASIGNIVSMLSKDFLILVFIAFLIASPIAWYAMSSWLDTFAYRVDMTWTVFLIAGIIAILVAFITVGIQGLRAALVNPIRALRDE